MAEAAARAPRGNGITIRDAEMSDVAPGGADAAAAAAPEQDARLEADGDYARQLQAKLDAEEARGGAEGGRRASHAHATAARCLSMPTCRGLPKALHGLWLSGAGQREGGKFSFLSSC
jgi:hypothetical protein